MQRSPLRYNNIVTYLNYYDASYAYNTTGIIIIIIIHKSPTNEITKYKKQKRSVISRKIANR